MSAATSKRGGLSPEALAVWRLLRDEGGYWTPGELAERLVPEKGSAFGSRLTGRWLLALRRRQHVAPRQGTHRVAAYGVTTRCLVPAGESVDTLAPAAVEGAAA